MKKRALICVLIVAAVLCLAGSAALARREQRELSAKLIRLHVIAHSDSEFDQNAKLRVRDAILGVIGEPGWRSREEAERGIRRMLPELKTAAEEELRRCGANQTAKAVLCRESYPTRCYPTFSLPAGEYLSLRVIIGDGKGKNWWCVVYPSVCGAAVADPASIAAAAGFTKNEVRLITQDAADVKIKFRLLEWVRAVAFSDRA